MKIQWGGGGGGVMCTLVSGVATCVVACSRFLDHVSAVGQYALLVVATCFWWVVACSRFLGHISVVGQFAWCCVNKPCKCI